MCLTVIYKSLGAFRTLGANFSHHLLSASSVLAAIGRAMVYTTCEALTIKQAYSKQKSNLALMSWLMAILADISLNVCL